VSAAQSGTVYLVGAGPGDPGLITVRARALLDDCDAIVHDALVHPELLTGTLTRRSDAPEMHFVGKRGGDDASARQDDIHALLVRLARAGRSVVRLKGGDPFVLGRGSEEAQRLAEAGIPFEVVPGVTAGVAGPAYAGIPVTHRGVATGVTFVTGHEDATKGSTQTDWAALARSGTTVVLYMGVGSLPQTAAALIAGGMAPDTPAAAIQWATYPAQRTVDATLATLADQVAAAGLTAPVITVIGRVVALRNEIRWFDRADRRPLLGQRILVTRATAQASALSERLRALGAAVTEMPATRLELLDRAPLAEALTRVSTYRHMVFTSQNAVRIVWDAMRAAGQDARALAGVVVSAVGPATADALLEHGIAVDVSPSRFVAEGVLEAFAERTDVRGARVLYPAALGARDVLPVGLRRLGAIVDVVPIYRSVFDGRGAAALCAQLAAGELDLVTVTSASAVRGYLEAVGPELAGRVGVASIGPVTSAAARAAGIPVVVESNPSTIAGLVTAVRSMTRRAPTPADGPSAAVGAGPRGTARATPVTRRGARS
jgi:uroporphyrinogen III methyltransferase/synthase